MRWILFLVFLMNCSLVSADTSNFCHGSFVNPITDICWSCLFPMSIGSVPVYEGNNPDTPNPAYPVCICSDNSGVNIGITVGYWEPIALVDVTRSPFCMVNLGGLQLDVDESSHVGQTETAQTEQNSSFYYVHWYVFPLISWLNLLTDTLCLESADFDIAYVTELDPTWNDDELAFILNPEAGAVSNPVAQAACAIDSLQAMEGLPNDKLFWCAGSQGGMYPITGHVQEHIGGVQASTLLTARMTYKLHREGLLWDSTGYMANFWDEGICHTAFTPILPKSRYRYQMVNPLPTTDSKGCFPFGHTTADWGSNHEYPYQGEDFGYLVWRKRNCCAF